MQDNDGRRLGHKTLEPIRIEETVEGDQLVVRAELPGIDPDTDVEERTLHIRAERRQETTEETQGRRHSEFRYGSASNPAAERRVRGTGDRLRHPAEW